MLDVFFFVFAGRQQYGYEVYIYIFFLQTMDKIMLKETESFIRERKNERKSKAFTLFIIPEDINPSSIFFLFFFYAQTNASTYIRE